MHNFHQAQIKYIIININLAVRMGHDPMTSAVVDDMWFEHIREVLNIHLAT